MAALDRRNPNLDDFVGLNWSCWIDRVNMLPSDGGSITEEGKYGMHRSDTMTLGKEDMDIFGHCPAHDNFYLVVCSHCGKVVKPQAFERHCERWHSAVTRLYGQSSNQASLQLSAPDQPFLNTPSRTEKQKYNKDSAVSSALLPSNRHCSNNGHKETLRTSSWHSGPLPPGDHSSHTSPSKSTLQKSTNMDVNASNTHQRGMRTYSRIDKNMNKKDYELNKHCRNLDQEKKKLCSRELTFNAKSATEAQHQKGSGKLSTHSQLAVEQKKISECPERERHPDLSDASTTSRGSKCLNNRKLSEIVPEESSKTTVEVDLQPPHQSHQNSLSTEDTEEEDEEEETPDLPATPWHPRPLALCTFGCHTLGVSIYTFDRRLHHLRFALSAMLERHGNSHMWRKMPQVSSGLRSHCSSSTTTGTSTKSMNKPSKSPGLHSQDSTSLGHPETKNFQQNSDINRPTPSSTSTNCGSGKRRNPIVRPRKSQLMEVGLLQDAKPAVNSERLLQNEVDVPSRFRKSSPLHEKAKAHVSSFQRPAKSNFSQEKKPCFFPTLPRTVRQMSDFAKPTTATPAQRPPPRRDNPPAVQQKTICDQRGSAQKRKSSGKSLTLSPSESRTSKYKCFSSIPCTNIISWKEENRKDLLSQGL